MAIWTQKFGSVLVHVLTQPFYPSLLPGLLFPSSWSAARFTYISQVAGSPANPGDKIATWMGHGSKPMRYLYILLLKTCGNSVAGWVRRILYNRILRQLCVKDLKDTCWGKSSARWSFHPSIKSSFWKLYYKWKHSHTQFNSWYISSSKIPLSCCSFYLWVETI